ncbi:MAG: radical SAM protein, partial [Pseudomonadota bacterium]
RGCVWGHCKFCLWVHSFIKGTVYNTRSVENVTEEVKFVQNRLENIRSMMFQDDTMPEDRAMALSESFLKAGIRLPWSCYARPNLSLECLKLMKKAGALNLHVGFESADRQIIKNAKKGITVEQMTQFAKDAKDAGVSIHGDFLFGLPGETEDTLKHTIEWAKELDPHTAQFQLVLTYPGMDEQGGLAENEVPTFSHEDLRKWAKKAYRSFYFRPKYMFRSLMHPIDTFRGKSRVLVAALPSVLWKKW